MTKNVSSTELFYRLIDCDMDEQNAILADIDRTMPELVSRVEALLSSPPSYPLTTLIDEHLSSTSNVALCFENEVVDRYRVEQELGRGGFGVVYFCSRNDPVFEQNFAIKFFKQEIVQLFGSSLLFREAQMLASLNHPFIAKVYDAGIHEGTVYIVMEHIEGVALSEYLNKSSLKYMDKLTLFCDICLAIEHAHSFEILHADLKPDNILIDAQGKPKLIDFNLTQQNEALSGLFAENSSDFVVRAASSDFASPEQIKGKPINTMADVYALGQILDLMFSCNGRSKQLEEVIHYASNDQIHLRYSTVGALRKDVENVRSRFPLTCHTQSKTHVALSIIQRHPVKVAVAIACSLSLISAMSIYISAYQSLQTKKSQLDSIVNELTALNYPMNNRLVERNINKPVKSSHMDVQHREGVGDKQLWDSYFNPHFRMTESFETNRYFEVNISDIDYEDLSEEKLHPFQSLILNKEHQSHEYDLEFEVSTTRRSFSVV